MNLKYLFLLFIIYSVLGWIMEVIATYKDNNGFVNRGFLIGPYCPIYGTCALLMILCLNNFKNPIMLFVMAIIIASFIEYMTSFLMEKIFKARWWDYSKRLLNINGRICLTNSLIFGVLGFVLIKIVNPYLIDFIKSMNPNVINWLFYSLSIVFIGDIVVSCSVISKIKETTKFVIADNTKEITKKIEAIISKEFLSRRLFKAFPNIKIKIKDIEELISIKIKNKIKK